MSSRQRETVKHRSCEKLEWQIVNFDQSDSSASVFACDDRSGVSGWTSDNDRGFRRTRGSVTGRFDLVGLSIAPVVVRSDKVSVFIEQHQDWVRQSPRDPEPLEGRTQSAHDDTSIIAAGDEAPNEHVILDSNKTAGADIKQK